MKQHIRSSWVVGSALGFALLAQAADKVKLDVKLGLWEVTTSGKTLGQIPDSMLQNVPPERRQQVIAAIQASASRPETHRQCLTADKLAQGFDLGGSGESCKRVIATNTSSSLSVTANCDGDQGKQVIKASFQATNRETVTGAVTAVVTHSGQTLTVDRDFRAKWLGASCGDAKE